jgi:hypothetical protein
MGPATRAPAAPGWPAVRLEAPCRLGKQGARVAVAVSRGWRGCGAPGLAQASPQAPRVGPAQPVSREWGRCEALGLPELPALGVAAGRSLRGAISPPGWHAGNCPESLPDLPSVPDVGPDC